MPKPVTRVRLKCLSCRKAFEAHAYRSDEAKYCSRECYREHRFRTGKTCPACGSKPPRGRRFCSEECWRNHWKDFEGKRYQTRKAGYAARRLAIVQALGGKCLRCGINDHRVLDIDHIERKKKLKPKHRSYPTPVRLALWEQEMQIFEDGSHNLQVLCANCHRLKTWSENNS